MDVQVQDCTSDTHWKKTFPDLDYSLLGYDILYGYPLANGRDPGFRHPIFSANYSQPKQTSDCRDVVPQGLTVIPSESCVVSFESKLVRNKQEMSEHLGVQAEVEGKLNLLISEESSVSKILVITNESKLTIIDSFQQLSHKRIHKDLQLIDLEKYCGLVNKRP